MIKKLAITIVSILGIGAIGSYIYFLKALTSNSMLGSIFILIGIILLITSQIILLYEIWSDEDEIIKR